MKATTNLSASVIVFFSILGIMPCALANNSSEIVSTEVGSVQKNTAHQLQIQREAKEWGLNTDEYSRYQNLMKGPRGIQSPGLDPITTLGIEAKSDAERRRYAELWVKSEFARTEKELVFQSEVDAAWRRLYPEILPINLGNAAGIAHDTQGRLALFVRIDDCVQCDARLTAILTEKRPVDIYIVDSKGDDNKIREWAKDKKIPIERVRTKEITLNHDEGRWIKYGEMRMPVVLQQNSDGSWRIAAF
ncbi:TIGR03759 family integrating conjugative element protein [Xenorhabdus bovienii]|uniref:TIGR03759 family integrating conjugative element protein n=1 Tax=Xenorhabdus bovienii TaxID=40576 RepID=UPI00304357AE|nr:TIGR03759 family integrating conjugative element protein [Xenorhabdus bovienii]MDE9475997.1 TIGR03759 family integrating conjugative element protein [Xenorhabdus bovienii]MDE9528766.1 TIGR03759 family integrating conjugative element protein [Xenorhabdus bovienii]